ncbi:MAG TPA: hypothetical protein VMB74_10155 [Streptosporangiaceae bacterium]|nr:hypothetical protein [Streptosporangiaceae bacterium]
MLNLAGALLSLSVAATIASGLVNTGLVNTGLITLTSAGAMGAAGYFIANAIGGTAGILVDLPILIAVSAGIYWRSRMTRVNPRNVNAEWAGGVAPAGAS